MLERVLRHVTRFASGRVLPQGARLQDRVPAANWVRRLSTEIRPSGFPRRAPPTQYVRFDQRNPSGPETKRGYVLVLGLAGAGGMYYVAHLDRAPYTGRRRMIDISPAQEKRLGEQQFQMILDMNAQQVLPSNHPTTRRISTIGQRIANVTEVKDFDWQFVVIDSREPNAFCLPGGKVAVFTGLLPLTPDDDALAAVLAHEIGHAVARHGAEKLGFMKLLFILQLLLATVIDTYALTSWLVKLLGDLPNSRKLESEADFIGLRLMTEACYNPNAAPKMFARLGQYAREHGASIPKYLSTHPNDRERIAQIEQWLGDVEILYENKCRSSYASFASFSGSYWT